MGKEKTGLINRFSLNYRGHRPENVGHLNFWNHLLVHRTR